MFPFVVPAASAFGAEGSVRVGIFVNACAGTGAGVGSGTGASPGAGAGVFRSPDDLGLFNYGRTRHDVPSLGCTLSMPLLPL